MQKEFNASAEVYRAQFQRILGGDPQSGLDKKALLEDIALLKRSLDRENAIATVESRVMA